MNECCWYETNVTTLRRVTGQTWYGLCLRSAEELERLPRASTKYQLQGYRLFRLRPQNPTVTKDMSIMMLSGQFSFVYLGVLGGSSF